MSEPAYPPPMVALMRKMPEGRAWLEALPGLISEFRERWRLALGAPYPNSFVSVVFPAEREDGGRAVLKLSFRDRETANESAALRLYAGEGSVRLLEADPERGALLLERAEPGTPLMQLPDLAEADAIAADVLHRLWRPVRDGHPFELAVDRAAAWAREQLTTWEATGRSFERELAEEAAALFADLAQAVEEPVLLHQDFHHDNVLAAEREPWLAIDPKPLAGERAFDVPCLLRNRTADVFSAARPGEAMGRRLDFFADALAVDRERVRMWALAQAVELGLWDYEVGLADHGERLIECARLFRGL